MRFRKADKDLNEFEVNRRLAKACLDGDEHAYAQLIERYSSVIYGIVHRITLNREDAAEVSQDVFYYFYRQLHKLDLDTINIAAYLCRMARNSAFDKIKKKAKYEFTATVPEPEQYEQPLELDPERVVMWRGSKKAVALANSRLPSRYRQVLSLRELEHMSYQEIGEVMELEANNVAQLVSRARLRLKEELLKSSAAIRIKDEVCRQALPLLSKKVGGYLDEEEQDWLDNHLQDCVVCGNNLECIEETGMSYRGLTPLTLSPVLEEAFAGILQNGVVGSGFGSAFSGLIPSAKSVSLGGLALVAAAGISLLVGSGLLSDEKNERGETRKAAMANFEVGIFDEAARKGRSRGEGTRHKSRRSVPKAPESPQPQNIPARAVADASGSASSPSRSDDGGKSGTSKPKSSSARNSYKNLDVDKFASDQSGAASNPTQSSSSSSASEGQSSGSTANPSSGGTGSNAGGSSVNGNQAVVCQVGGEIYVCP